MEASEEVVKVYPNAEVSMRGEVDALENALKSLKS